MADIHLQRKYELNESIERVNQLGFKIISTLSYQQSNHKELLINKIDKPSVFVELVGPNVELMVSCFVRNTKLELIGDLYNKNSAPMVFEALMNAALMVDDDTVPYAIWSVGSAISVTKD